VIDNGCGIAPDALPHIFERLYRADSSRVAKHGGSGLGLAIVKAIVEAHGGAVTAASTLGAGTRMIIRLPLGATAST
jgi:signal transduction histidine kinase